MPRPEIEIALRNAQAAAQRYSEALQVADGGEPWEQDLAWAWAALSQTHAKLEQVLKAEPEGEGGKK